MALLSDHAIYLPHCKTYVPHHSEASHPGHSKMFQHHPTAHSFGAGIHHVNLLLVCNLNLPSSTILSCLSFRCQTGLRVFYMTPALHFWYIVVLMLFTSFFLLTGLHHLPLCPPSFIIVYKPGSILYWSAQVPDPSPFASEVICIIVSTKYTLQVLSESSLDDLPPSLAPTGSPILFQPFAHGLDLLDTISSFLVHLDVVLRGRKQAPISAKF